MDKDLQTDLLRCRSSFTYNRILFTRSRNHLTSRYPNLGLWRNERNSKIISLFWIASDPGFLGVIHYTMWSGEVPSRSWIHNTAEEISRSKWSENTPGWKNVSEAAKDLVRYRHWSNHCRWVDSLVLPWNKIDWNRTGDLLDQKRKNNVLVFYEKHGSFIRTLKIESRLDQDAPLLGHTRLRPLSTWNLSFSINIELHWWGFILPLLFLLMRYLST